MKKDILNIQILTSMLTVLFVYLKLTNQISWGWFWVLSPLTIPLSIAGFLVVLLIIIKLYGKYKGFE